MSQIKFLKISNRSLLEFLLIIAILLSANPTLGSLRIGGAIVILGLVLRIVASGYKYQIEEFMVRGPYRYVRHPHYLGSILIMLGMCMTGRNPFVAAVASILLCIFYAKSIKSEEQKLMKAWGSRYKVFKANVSAIIPQLLPVVPAGGEGKKYTFKNALLRSQLRELSALISILSTYMLMYWAVNVENMMYYYIVTGGICCVFLLFRPLYYSLSKNR